MDIYDSEAHADFAPDDLPFHSPEYIYRWLKTNPFDPSENYPWSKERTFEKELLALNSSLVNFGLAKFGASSNTMKRLYSLEDSSIRYAALSGVGVSRDKTARNWVDDILDDIAENLDDEGLEAIRALITNQNIPDDILINFLRRTDFFSQVDEDDWMDMLSCFSGNQRLQKSYAKPIFDDESVLEANSYYRPVYESWRLYERLEVSQHTALALRDIAEPLRAVWKPCLQDQEVLASFNSEYLPPIKIDEQISKWQDPDLFDPELGVDSEDVIFEQVRSHLIKLYPPQRLEFERLKLSMDRAVRRGVYRYHPEPDKDLLLYAASVDGEVGLEEMLWNKLVFRDPVLREELKKICWSQPMILVEHESGRVGRRYIARKFEKMKAVYEKCYPNWFV